jgi:threonine/homoserine/homoserine lactone efflux protein
VPEGRHDLAQARHGYSVAPADVDASQQGDVGGHVVILIPSIPVDNYCCGVIDDVAVLPYTLAFLVVLIAPGPDFALVVRNAGRCGRPAGVATAAGIASGLSVHAGIVAVGSGAMIAASAVAFTVVKIAGAAYLVVLGLVTLIGTFRRRPGSGSAAGDERRAPVDEPGASLSLGRAYRQGLLCNVLNPKAVLTYLALMPQFLPANPSPASTVLLSAITVLSAIGWLRLVALAVAAARRVLQRPRVRQALDAATGSVLITFGVRVATQPAR